MLNENQVLLENVRLSYNNIEVKNDTSKKFQGTFLISKTTVEGKKMVKKITDIRDRMLAERKVKIATLDEEDIVLRDGDLKLNKEGEPDPAYANHYYVVAKADKKVKILDRNKQEVLDAEDSPLYSGCYVDTVINLYSSKEPKYKGVYAGLNTTRFRAHGEPLAGAVGASADVFADIEDDEDLI